MKLSKLQIEVLAKQLDNPWGHVSLMCDGFKVSLAVQRCKGISYRVMTYVNGEWKGVWVSGKNEHPEQKFMRKRVRPCCSSRHKKEMEKIIGKRRVKEDPYYSATTTSYMPDWPSGKAALNHLNKVCKDITLAE